MKKTRNVILIVIAAVFITGSSYAAETPAKKDNPSEVSETLIGDVVADAMREAMGADAAIINAGSLGEGALPKEINEDTLDSVVPYPSDIVVVIKIKGGDLLAALEKSVSSLPRRSSGFLQVSGVGFTADPNKKSGSRVGNVRVNGEALDPKAVYTLALTDYLSNGGSGYASCKNGELVEENEMSLGEIVLKHANVTDEVRESVGDRIKIIRKKSDNP